MKILVIEDDPKLNRALTDQLKTAGHTCQNYTDGQNGLNVALRQEHDLLLLDLRLPGISGLEILEQLRNSGVDRPTMVLSALDDTDTVIKALDLGAIDYIKKPFNFGEMLARVRNTQRRLLPASTIVRLNNLTINLMNRETMINDKVVALSKREFSVLEFLLMHDNKVVTRAQILKKVWDLDFDPGSNIVEVHIYQLRKKLELEGEPDLIQTIIGKGYIISGEVFKN